MLGGLEEAEVFMAVLVKEEVFSGLGELCGEKEKQYWRW